MKKLVGLLFGILFLLSAVPANAAAPATGPDGALAPDGTAQTVAAQSEQWYQLDLGGHKAALSVTLDAVSREALRLAIYTPEQVANWQSGDALKALGMGGAQADHTLGWYGTLNQAGTYYAVVYNDSDAPVTVTVRASGDALITAQTATATSVPDDPLLPRLPVSNDLSGRIAFLDAEGGNLYTVNADGTNLQRVSFGMDPQWNHDGTQLALARQGPVAGVFVINADGSNERLLYATNEARAPDWSADDSTIVFSHQAADKGGGTVTFRGRIVERPTETVWRIGAVDLAEGIYADVRSSNNATTPSWNVNGIIAYNDASIGLMTTTSNGEPASNPFLGDLRITSDSYNPLRIVSPQYSPDGTKIVYMVMQSPTWQIAVANADGSDAHLLTSDVVLALTHPSSVSPVWSPDGSQIMFLSNRNGKWEFFVINADGSNMHQVLKDVTESLTIQYDFQAARMLSWTR